MHNIKKDYVNLFASSAHGKQLYSVNSNSY